jgi:hypothetical protein
VKNSCIAQSSPDSIPEPQEEEILQKIKWVKPWGEFYDESMSMQKERENFISCSHIRQGLMIARIPKVTLQSYLLIRYGKDLHKDFWNNRAEIGLGLRARFFTKIFLALYVEWIRGYYIKIPENLPQASDDNYVDLRTGLIFWYGWDKWFESPRLISFPLIRWGELYSDVSYFRSQRDNVIGYFHAKAGFRLCRLWKSDLAAYGVLYLMKDTNKDFWNNKVEFGPGIWLSPFPNLDLKIFTEWLVGNYFGIEGVDPNPYTQRYGDRRVGILFWIGW